MPADTLTSAADSASASAKQAARSAMETSQKSFNEAVDLAERNIREAAKRIDKAVREAVDAIKTQSGPYRDTAVQQFDEAQKYVVERVKERPVTATLAGLGVGLLIGLLLASRSSK